MTLAYKLSSEQTAEAIEQLAQKIEQAEKELSEKMLKVATMAAFSSFSMEIEVEQTQDEGKRKRVTGAKVTIHAEI